MRLPVALCAGVLTALAPVAGRAQDQLPASLTQIGLDQRLGEQLPLDLPFCDEDGRAVQLGDYSFSQNIVLKSGRSSGTGFDSPWNAPVIVPAAP
jgi:hypothetical protein